MNAKSVLIIDDSEEDRAWVRRTLKKAPQPYEVHDASDGKSAKELLKSLEPDCILLDYFLPDVTGDRLITEIRQSGFDVGIVVLTGQGDSKSAVSCMQNGANDYLGKEDINHENLSRSITNAINKVELERKQQENRILAVENAKLNSLGIIVSGIAHEINNPLSILNGYTTIVFNKLKNGNAEELDEHFQQIISASNRIESIVTSLHRFCGEISSENIGKYSPFNLVKPVEKFILEKLNSKKIAFSIESPKINRKIECSDAQIVQVLLNLVENSVQAIENTSAPWIKIVIEESGDEACISIIDSGPGIDQEVRKNLMTPFFTTKDVGKGKGLGLATSRGVIEKYKGRIVYAEHLENTCFQIYLPLVADEKTVQKKSA